MIRSLAFALTMSCSAVAMAQTAGSGDTVIYIQTMGPHCLGFQTANGGGTFYGIGDGNGQNAMGGIAAAMALDVVAMSRRLPNVAPPVNFTIQYDGYYGDCPSGVIGVTGVGE